MKLRGAFLLLLAIVGGLAAWWLTSGRPEPVATEDPPSIHEEAHASCGHPGCSHPSHHPAAGKDEHGAEVEATLTDSAFSAPAASRVSAPPVEQAFSKYQDERVQPLPAMPLLTSLSKSVVGDRVRLEFPGFTLHGQLTGRLRDGKLEQFGVDLEEAPGRAVFSVSGAGKVLGHVVFNGESRAFSIEGDRYADWEIEATSVSSIFCAPRDATYPLVGNSGFLAVNSTPRASVAAAAGTFSQIALSSLPSSDYVLYIDFDGETVTSPFWAGGATINAEPHPQAANASWVTVVWQRVAEDYAPFNINVTTDRAVFNSADVDKRQMCVVTPTGTAFPGSGGVAILGSFGEGIPCWTFNLPEYACADTISHEFGHTFDLVHDGDATDSDEYFDGHGTGETAWGPIMGAPFEGGNNQNVTQWSIGEYNNAVNYFTSIPEPNTQDDLAVIAATGFGFRPDDGADSANLLAESLDISGSVVSDDGLIEMTGDIDFFKFSTVGGAVEINADPLNVNSQEGEDGSDTFGANLAIELKLYDDGGVELLSDNPTSTLGASISTTLAEGDYFISVQGVGRNDPATSGFSDYASLGHYFITGIVASGPLSVLGGQALDVLIADGDTTPSGDDGTAFGLVAATDPVGLTSTFRLENTLASELTISAISFGGTQFSFDVVAPLVIPASSTLDLPVTFNPSDIGIVVDTLSLTYFETAEPGTIFSYTFDVQGVVTKTADDDNYEENDSFFDAFPLPGETSLVNILGDGRQADNDWYRINVVPGFNSITVTAEFDSIDGDIDLALYDSNGFFLFASEGTGDVESLNFVVSENGGPHYVRVYGEGNGNTYNLFWEGLSPLLPTPATEDAYEPNNSYFDAYDIAAIKGDMLSTIAGPGVQLDSDWYELTVKPKQTEVTVSATNTSLFGSVFLALYDAQGYLIQASETNGFFEEITYTGTTGTTTYYVRVYGDNTGSSYDLTYQDRRPRTTPAGDDNYEANDNFFQPFDLSGSEGVALSAVDGPGAQFNPDWFGILSADGENVIEVTLDAFTAAPDSANFTLSVYDWRGYQITTRTNPVIDEAILLRAPLGVTEYYVVATGDNIGDTYSFIWDSRFVPEDDDIYEENDTLAEAFDIKNRENERLSRVSELGIQSDEDWYEIQLFAGDGAIRASLEFTHADGNIDFAIYDAGGSLIAEAASNTDDEALAVELPVSASDVSFFLLVTGTNSGNSYDLSWSSVRDLTDDNYEENDFFDESYVLPQTTSGLLSDVDGLGIQSDFDFFTLRVPDDATLLQLTLTFTDADGDIDIAVYDQDEDLLDLSISITDNEFLQIPTGPFVGQDLFVLIYFANAGNTYDLEWTFTVPGSGALDVDGDLLGDNWEASYYGRLSAVTGSSNSDGDGLEEWAEFALNTNPLAVDTSILTPYIEGDYLRVRFVRNKDAVAAGYQYRVLESADLDFSDAGEAVFVDAIDHGDFEEAIYRSTAKVGEMGQCFFQLEVEQPAP